MGSNIVFHENVSEEDRKRAEKTFEEKRKTAEKKLQDESLSAQPDTKKYVKLSIHLEGEHILVPIKRIDKDLPLPVHETAGSIGVDLICRLTTVVAPNELLLLPTNIIVATPPGYVFVVLPRSSTFRKTGLVMPHSMGIIDSDYCGPEDEIMLQVCNMSKISITIERGSKIAQGILLRTSRIAWSEEEEIISESRGGFGSTE